MAGVVYPQKPVPCSLPSGEGVLPEVSEKNSCSVCDEEIKETDQALDCDVCKKEVHEKCWEEWDTLTCEFCYITLCVGCNESLMNECDACCQIFCENCGRSNEEETLCEPCLIQKGPDYSDESDKSGDESDTPPKRKKQKSN